MSQAASSTMTRHLDAQRLQRADTVVRREPFAFLIATEQLSAEFSGAYAADFPRYSGAGFFPYAAEDCGPSIQALVADLTRPEFARALGEHLGVADLDRFPTLVTLCRSLNLRHGTIHTDSQSKVVTALLYLSESWPETSAGCLRFLANKNDINALVAPELRPLFGNLAVFRRCDNSFHGHLPFEGERHVIQVAWLTSEAEKLRKTQRGRLSRLVKWLLGGIDKRWKSTNRGP